MPKHDEAGTSYLVGAWKRDTSIASRAALIVFSTLFALLLCEGFLRVYKPHSPFGLAKELDWMRNSPGRLTEVFTIDPEFGFRPRLGNSIYNEYGTLVNDYSIRKAPPVTRLLFMGDSVTVRGKIIGALKREYGEKIFEYWNAGVESFNTVQEVRFYRRYNARINPDHVILTFHMNDFETTPIAFVHYGKLVVYAPDRPVNEINAYLFQNSYIYRLLLGALTRKDDRNATAIAQEIEDHLVELSKVLNEQGARFSVLVLPILKPYADWSDEELRARRAILKILETNKIRHFDLLPPLEEAIAVGTPVQELKGDAWHPSGEVAAVFAAHLRGQQLF